MLHPHSEILCGAQLPGTFVLKRKTVPAIVSIIHVMSRIFQFQKDAESTDQEDVYYDMKANKRADYYFAFFLCCECWLLLSVTLLHDASESVAGLAGLMRNVVCCV